MVSLTSLARTAIALIYTIRRNDINLLLNGASRARATVHNGVAGLRTPTDERAASVPESGHHHSFFHTY